ncbi:inhibitor of growth protein 1-like isoform X1 [Cololabis saira]|uniref:inhibitor of growth protein 1-like isoform X1 n=1 Tax=Cololabis saira TaxID=129043 RepID=UPI002AD55B51|nr:inhibitor of growth protein 1-like isoform X1 [Cololabis saira]
MDYSDVLSICNDINISVSEEQARAVEVATRDQASSKLWFRFRAGRITASKMKTACCTDPNKPAQSLIKSVCYPESYKFTSKAMTWGCDHETFARDIFINDHKKRHENVKAENTGFFINPSVPFSGASPDGLVSCDCCGVSVIEVKCPFCVKNDMVDCVSYLEKDDDGKLKLNRKHQYFYQVQTQLGVCKLESAYFVVWTEKDLHVELITFDEEFWDTICKKSKRIFDTAIMPELVGKYYTRLSSTMAGSSQPDVAISVSSEPLVALSLSSQPGAHASDESHGSDCATSASQQEQTYCFCDQVEFGKMICCDYDKCQIQWFHYSCVNVQVAPKGKWYCLNCRKLPQFLSKRARASKKT